MRALLITLAILTTTQANAAYKLSTKDIKIATKNIQTSFPKASVTYVGRKTLRVSLGNETCDIKNVTFERYSSGKAIDEKTYNKVETCLE